MILAISGALLMGYIVVALFFLKFWRQTGDRLFALFSSAFALLALQRSMLLMATVRDEDATIYYVIRLIAFLLILIAVIDKNRKQDSY